MRLLVASSVALAALAGCGGDNTLSIEASPESSLADEAVHLRVEEVRARAVVSVTLTSTDADGTVWRSSARYRADDEGAVDLDRAAPLAGDYAGARGMGLVWALRPTEGLRVYAWAASRPFDFVVRASSPGRDAAATTITRRLSQRPLTRANLSVDRVGFRGQYFAPTAAEPRPALLVLGGSDGGLSVYAREIARALAARGYPALALAYFAEPGLPDYLYRIPLEYFATALRWLGRRPEVDPSRLLTYGVSRGSEAALLLGAHFPRLVHGVVAAVPSNIANLDSWTIGGKVVPRSEIPVERIRGSVLAVCGTVDTVWPSCRYARALAARLRRHAQPHTLVVLAGAGHAAGGLIPYAISSLAISDLDEVGSEQFWSRLLAFLREASR